MDQYLKFTPTESTIYSFLKENSEFVPKKAVMKHVYPHLDFDDKFAVYFASRSFDVFVCRINRKIARSGQTILRNRIKGLKLEIKQVSG